MLIKINRVNVTLLINTHRNIHTMNNRARCIQKSERECSRLTTNQDVPNSHTHVDTQVDVICSLRDNIRRLLTENDELCDLCCLLDDDRQQYRQDAAEWQKLHQQIATEITEKVCILDNEVSILTTVVYDNVIWLFSRRPIRNQLAVTAAVL